jgi:hypothetical protein
MAKPLSMDLRERAISRVEAGGSVRAVAASLSISPSCVVKRNDFGRRAASRRERWAVISRAFCKVRMPTGCGNASLTPTSPCAGSWPSSPNVG